MRLVLARLSGVIAIFCAGFLTGPVTVVAQDTPSTPEASPTAFEAPKFVIVPVGDFENGWFELELEPGASVDLTAGVGNAGNVPAELRTYSTNAFNPPNGGFAAATEEDEPVGPTTWVTYPAQTFEMAPGDQRLIDFQLTIPEDTLPGEYVTALVVQTAEAIEIPGSETLDQIIRSAVSIEITVPGEMTTGFELGEPTVIADTAGWTLEVPVTSTGTARVRPKGELTFSTADGEEVSTTDIEMGSVYGGNTSSVRVTLPGQLSLGDYSVSLNLSDEASGESESISNAPVTLAVTEVSQGETFVVEQASVTPNGEPIQYADVAATITNSGAAIPTANVNLTVQRDGKDVESYPLAENQALASGTTELSQRYIPVGGWESGTWTFQLVISEASGGTETVLATVEIEDEIVVP